MLPALPALSRLRSLWRCGTPEQADDQATPVLLRWINRNSAGQPQVSDLSQPGRYRLTARSHALVVPYTADGTRALSLTTRTDRADGRWTTSVALVQTPDQAWVHSTVEHSPPDPDAQLRLPQAALGLMSTLTAIDGHTPLPSRPVRHHNAAQQRALADALTDPSRLLPLVLVRPPNSDPGWRFPEGLPHSLVGMAAVHVMDAPTRQEIHSLLPVGAALKSGRLLILSAGRRPVQEFALEDPHLAPRVLAAVAQHTAQTCVPTPVAQVLQTLTQHTRELEERPTAPERVHTTSASPPSHSMQATNAPNPEVSELAAEHDRIRLTTYVERLRTELTRVADQAARASARAQKLDLELVALAHERDHLAERAQRTQAEVDWLRSQAATQGLHRLANAQAPLSPPTAGPPRRVEELLERITDSGLPHLRFTLEEAPVYDLALDRAKEPLWVGRAWEALWALEDWCRYREDHPDQACGLHTYLTHAPDGYRVIPLHRLVSTESDYVRANERLSAQRMFPVPTQVDPGGQALMLAHIRLDTDYGICPRLYFLPDSTSATVVVGYLGRHLKTQRTN